MVTVPSTASAVTAVTPGRAPTSAAMACSQWLHVMPTTSKRWQTKADCLVVSGMVSIAGSFQVAGIHVPWSP